MKQPEIRFKGFEGEWDYLSFKQAFSFLKNNSLSRAELDYSNGCVKNVHYGDVLIKYGELLNLLQEKVPYIKESTASTKISNDFQLRNGDIIFADAAEDNTVGKCTEIRGIGNLERIVSGLHTIPCRPNCSFEDGYLGYYLNSSCYHDQLLPHIQGTKISSISKRALSLTHLAFPNNPDEQQAIANYFKSLDSLIQTTTKKIASLKQLKSASLVSMFPQEGETKPRVRFKGFEGEWKKKRLNDISKFSKGRGYSKNDLCEKGSPIILYGRLYTRYNTVIDCIDTFATKKENSVLSKGNEIIIPASGETPEDIARASVVTKKDVILGGDLNIIMLENGYDPHFSALSITYSSIHTELAKYAHGKTVVHLHNSEIGKSIITYPSLTEQQKIASFFSSLDAQISLQSQRLEKLKQIKSACLDKMFV